MTIRSTLHQPMEAPKRCKGSHSLSPLYCAVHWCPSACMWAPGQQPQQRQRSFSPGAPLCQPSLFMPPSQWRLFHFRWKCHKAEWRGCHKEWHNLLCLRSHFVIAPVGFGRVIPDYGVLLSDKRWTELPFFISPTPGSLKCGCVRCPISVLQIIQTFLLAQYSLLGYSDRNCRWDSSWG